MPLYEYQCAKCGHRFEVIQKGAAKRIRRCPKCGGKTDRLLSSPAIQFRGTGWYVTDYRKKSGEKPSGEEKADDKDKDKKKKPKDSVPKPGSKAGDD